MTHGGLLAWLFSVKRLMFVWRRKSSSVSGLGQTRLEMNWPQERLLEADSPKSTGEGSGKNTGESSGKSSGKGSGKGSGKSSGKDANESTSETEEAILSHLKATPKMTIPELANSLQISTRAVEKQLKKLKTAGLLRRIGAAKGGHWEVQNILP
jgi:biotin operon repressor